jgi:uncharacterized RDD family membrane protein YckC
MTEPVTPGPQLAGLGPRVIAFLLDWVVGYAILFLAVAILGAVVGAVSESLGSLIGLLGSVAAVAYGFWQVYQEGTTGQTLGKRHQDVRLVGVDNGGRPVGFGLAFARYLVNALCGVFWLLPLVDARRQTVGDKVSKTIVVPA